MSMEKRICQSCGMPIKTEGTHGDGHPNEDFCINCYKDGFFLTHSFDEQIDINTTKRLEEFNNESGRDLSKEDAIKFFKTYLKGLKRWMAAEEQASYVLDKCGYVTLATISEDGFPRPVAVDVLRHNGIKEIWMTTFLSSEKARHLKANNKAGISFVHEADSVSLIGQADIITDKEVLKEFYQDFFAYYFPDGVNDKNYCLIRFITDKAVLWIDRVTHRISYN